MTESSSQVKSLKFTGERFVPEKSGEIELEHIHRYRLASDLVAGKTVLDIACGEGYGSAQLSISAKKVIGVDISSEAVNHAQEKYQIQNLNFLCGSCAEIPVKTASIDIVVSFETIEHHDQHELMMLEIKRVLKEDGVLIISSPDKLEYTDVPQRTNPHHVKELYRDEFENLIKSHFKNHCIYGQRVTYGSAIFCEKKRTKIKNFKIETYNASDFQGVPNALYLIAIASDNQLPEMASGLLEKSTNVEQEQAFAQQRLATAEQEQAFVQQRLATAEQELVNVAQRLATAEQELNTSKKQSGRLKSEVTSIKNELATHKTKNDRLKNELVKIAAKHEDEVAEYKGSTSWRLTFPLRLLKNIAHSEFRITPHKIKGVLRKIIHVMPTRIQIHIRSTYTTYRTLSTHKSLNSKDNKRALDAIITSRCNATSENFFSPVLYKPTHIELPEIDISIVTFNSQKWIEEFFNSLLSLNYPKHLLSVHFVDQSPTDLTLEALKAEIPKLIDAGISTDLRQKPNRGFGAGHNIGIRCGKAPYCLITNMDLTFEPDSLLRIAEIAASDSNNVASWELRQKPFEHPKFYDPITGLTNWSSHACILLRRSSFEDIGGYDETIFMYGEDVELSYRLRRSNYLLRYCPRAVVWHYTYENKNTIKPLQYSGSIFSNMYLRCIYGNWSDIAVIPLIVIGLIARPNAYPGSKASIIRNVLRLLKRFPTAISKRRASQHAFPFRGLDYELTRSGAFHKLKELQNSLPLISVITRTYKDRKLYLQQAMLSVIQQTYPNIEHIIVEDGGDTYAKMISDFPKTDNRKVKYISLRKVGRSQAGNEGLNAAQGSYCLFLDDDDFLFADHIEVLFQSLKENKDAVAAYSLAWEVVTDTNELSNNSYNEISHHTPTSLLQNYDAELIKIRNYFPIQSVLFKRTLYESRGGFKKDMDALEDWNLWVRYSWENTFIYVPKTTSSFRTPSETSKKHERIEAFNRAYESTVKRSSNNINELKLAQKYNN